MMSLQFIFGGSGSGKSTYLYRMISREAAEHRDQKYWILVPDQFTLQTQKTMVEMSGNNGILNVDVLSFHRLAYRVFEEVPVLQKTVLEDMGKMMLLRKVLSEQKDNLTYFKRGLYKPGFLDECKSFLCELMQYAIHEDDFDRMEEIFEKDTLMLCKIRDLRLIYCALKEKMGDTYMMAEELIPQLSGVVAGISSLRDSVICLDGFTGFTPTQYELLGELMRVCDRMLVTVTTDRTHKRGDVFAISTDTIRKLTDLAKETGTIVEEPVLTGDGEDRVPYRLLKSNSLRFLEEHLFSYTGEVCPEEHPDLFVRVCKRASDEASYVAREIKRLVKEESFRYDEIAVVTGDISAYEASLTRAFDRMNIRYFMDYKKNMGANAMAEYVLSFMAMYRKNMDYESTFRFLRCGLSPLTREETDVLENYVIAQGRRGIRSYQQEWKYEVARTDLVLVNEYRQKMMDSLQETIKRLRGGKKTVRTFTGIIYQLIVDNRLYERIQEQSHWFEEEKNLILAREYRSIYRLMMELLNELVELLGDQEVTFREYEELLSAGISEGLIGFVPPTSNQVIVGDVERSRLGQIRALFFLGVNDDKIPKVQGTQGILSERERKRIEEAGIELAPTPEKQAGIEKFYLYLTMTKPSQRLYMTYSKMDDAGDSKRPSYLIQKVMSLFSHVTLEEDEKDPSLSRVLGDDRGKSYLIRHLSDRSYGKDPVFWEIASYYKKTEPELISSLFRAADEKKELSQLSKEAADRLYGEEIWGSVSRLEMFAKCPYAHFVFYGLGLSEREEYTVQPMDYGNIFHRSMEHFSHRMEELHTDWHRLSSDQALEMAEESVDYVIQDYRGDMFSQSHRVAYTVQRIKRVMCRAVWGMWRQMQEGNFSQKESEESFFVNLLLDENKKMKLQGVIDRVDTCESEDKTLIKIVDYKSSKQQLSLDRVYYGLQLQLLTYMQAAIELESRGKGQRECVPAAMLYYPIHEPQMEWRAESEQEREIREEREFRCSGYVNEDPKILEKLENDLVKDGVLQPQSARSIPVRINKKEEFVERDSCVLTTEQFKELMSHTNEKLKEFGTRIFEGEIKAAPYGLSGHCGCDYCGLSGMCGMELRQQKDRIRELEPMREEDVWEALHERDSVDKRSEENH